VLCRAWRWCFLIATGNGGGDRFFRLNNMGDDGLDWTTSADADSLSI